MNQTDKQLTQKAKQLARKECANLMDGICIDYDKPCFLINPKNDSIHDGIHLAPSFHTPNIYIFSVFVKIYTLFLYIYRVFQFMRFLLSFLPDHLYLAKWRGFNPSIVL